MQYSAAEGSFSPWASRQMFRFSIFFPVMLGIAVIDIRLWLKWAYVIYGIVLVLLIAVTLVGITSMGATRWINVGMLTLQPSELMKICLVFALARYFHGLHAESVSRITSLIIPFLIIAVPVGFIMEQPDLGTGMIVLLLGAILLFVAGVSWWKFGVVGAAGLAALPVAWHYLHEYQRQRVLMFLNPEADPLGNGYNVIQSMIAVGSGGIFGKGFLKGTQSQLSFLPEKQTDFIFTMLSEEFGFTGGVLVITLYALIIATGIYIALKSRNHFGRLMAIGITSIIFLHVSINIGMAIAILPVVGAPLPLLSYGGTIMMTVMVGSGLLLNVQLYGDEKLDRSLGRL